MEKEKTQQEDQSAKRLRSLIVDSPSFQQKIGIIEANKQAAERTKNIKINNSSKSVFDSVVLKTFASH